MDAVKTDTLTSPKSLLVYKNASETIDLTKENNDDLFVDEIDEDDEIHLRLSDDEEFEHDQISEHAENLLQTRLQLIRDDFKTKESSHFHVKKSIIKKSLARIKTVLPITEDKSSNTSNLDEKVVNDTCDLDDNELIMSGNSRIPPLMQNSPKYWSNGFDKQWKGEIDSSRDRSFSHRKSNDWYNKDKLKKKKSFNGHHKYHFHNKIRDNSRETYDEQSISSMNSKPKEEVSESKKVKKQPTVPEKSTIENSLIVENSISEDSSSKENDSLEKTENFINDESDNLKSFSEDKSNKLDLEDDLGSERKSGNTDLIFFKNGTSKDNEKPPNDEIGNKISLEGKNCDESTEVDKKLCESYEKNNDVDSKVFSEKKENELTDETDSSVVNTQSEKKDVSKTDSLPETNKETIESRDISETENSNLSMEVREDTVNLAQNDIKSIDNYLSDDNQCTQSKIQDCKTDENNSDKNMETSFEMDSKTETETETENNDEHIKSENNLSEKSEELQLHIDEDSNLSLRSEKSLVISEMDITEHDIEPIDEEKKLLSNEETSKEMMDIAKYSESPSTLSTAVAESQQSYNESNDSKISVDSDNENTCEKLEEKNVKTENNQPESEKESNKEDPPKPVDKTTKSDNSEEKTTIIEEVDLIDDEPDTEESSKDETTNDKPTLCKNVESNKLNTNSVAFTAKADEQAPAPVLKKKRRKRNHFLQENLVNDVVTENGARIKRRSAKNAEEMIRKGIMKSDEEDDDSNDSSNLVTINYKKTNLPESPHPPALKRTLEDAETVAENSQPKKVKAAEDTATENLSTEPQEKTVSNMESEEKKNEMNDLVKKVSQEDIRKTIKNMTKKEVEAILLQKVVECIAVRGEMGKLREQARNSQRALDATRAKCQQLQKQVEGFDMVLKRINFEKTNNADKFVQPIKINRSVGLQVNFVVQDHGVVSLKQMQMLKTGASNPVSQKANPQTSLNSGSDNRTMAQSPKKMVKTRSPRRPEISAPPNLQPIISSNSITNTSNNSPAVTVSKSVDSSSKRYSIPSSASIVHLVPQQNASHQIVVNSNVNIGAGITRTTNSNIQRSSGPQSNKSSDLIDLTDEEEKTKTSTLTSTLTGPRVLKAVPANVTLNSSGNLRLLQAGNPGSPTTIVNNLNNQTTVAYVMQNGVIGQRQLVLKSTNGIRPGTPGATRNISAISYKQGAPPLNAVRVLTTPNSTSNLQLSRHPAPLPEAPPSTTSNPQWKLPPPGPTLKINKVPTGIVLSWNMTLSDKFAKIVSYQLFAYQEITGTAPSVSLWKKVGDVAALPLPMACTLTQFTAGNNYHFAVRAIDIHSRYGQYSKPGNISL